MGEFVELSNDLCGLSFSDQDTDISLLSLYKGTEVCIIKEFFLDEREFFAHHFEVISVQFHGLAHG